MFNMNYLSFKLPIKKRQIIPNKVANQRVIILIINVAVAEICNGTFCKDRIPTILNSMLPNPPGNKDNAPKSPDTL